MDQSPIPFPAEYGEKNHVEDRCPPKRLAAGGRQDLRCCKKACGEHDLAKNRHAQPWMPINRGQHQAKGTRKEHYFEHLRRDGFGIGGHASERANVGNQRLATAGLATPLDSIASPLHCVVRTASSPDERQPLWANASQIARAVNSDTPGHPTAVTIEPLLLVINTL